MKVIIVGCGRMGAELADRLSKRKVDVSIIDIDEAAFSNLPADFHGRTVEGDALNKDTMHRAGIEHANALAAVTDSDALNAVICHAAREYYGVELVVARNYQPSSRQIFDTFNIQVISATSWGAQRMEEMLYHSEIRVIYSSGNGEIELYEFTIPAAWDGHKVSEVVPQTNCVVTSLTRAGRASLVNPEFILQTGDIIHISATFEGVEELRKCLQSSQEVQK